MKVQEPIRIPLADIKRQHIGEVNHLAEQERGRWITLDPGKIGEYQLKFDEFKRWHAAGRPEPEKGAYPIAEAEAGPWGLTTVQMLTLYGAKSAELIAHSARIASVTREALIAIDRAANLAEIQAAVNQFKTKIGG